MNVAVVLHHPVAWPPCSGVCSV